MNPDEIEKDTELIIRYADEALKRVGILNNPYFESLHDGSMSLECFQKTQEQFYFAVHFFPRPMALLIARLPEPKMRLDILRNLLEEHGEFQESGFHVTSFRFFLQSIKVDPTRINDLPLWATVRAFNSVLIASCTFDEIEVGLGCMGIIEYAFSEVSALIGQGVVKRQWVPTEELAHYKLHAELDKQHAKEFFDVIEPKWAKLERRYFIHQGLELGAYIFDRLYRDLYKIGSIQKNGDGNNSP